MRGLEGLIEPLRSQAVHWLIESHLSKFKAPYRFLEMQERVSRPHEVGGEEELVNAGETPRNKVFIFVEPVADLCHCVLYTLPRSCCFEVWRNKQKR